MRMIKEKEQKRKLYQQQHGYARPPMSSMLGDKRMLIIGSGIYKQVQDGEYSPVNLAHDCGLELFGEPYLEEQEQMPLDQRHPALQWMYTYVEHREHLENQEHIDPKDEQIGAGGAWLRFGYDLFTIRDNAKLHARLKERLLKLDSFQGARHELAVASMCVAAGFDIEFEDDSDNQRNHTEFIGTDKITGAKIAVEAKSRHRKGVKGFASGRDIPPEQEVAVRGLVLDGFDNTKGCQYPSYIFVDANLPPVPDEPTFQRWLAEIDQTMNDLAAEGYADPCPVNAVFFINDPSHYLLTERVDNDAGNLWFQHYLAATPSIAHPAPNMVERFFNAFRARISPPAEFPGFQ